MIYRMQKEVIDNLIFKTFDYDGWFTKEELDDEEESVDLSHMRPLEGDEEVKEGKGSKMLAPNKLLTRLPMILAQIKAGNNLDRSKNEIRQILYLLYQHNKITKKVYNKLIKSL